MRSPKKGLSVIVFFFFKKFLLISPTMSGDWNIYHKENYEWLHDVYDAYSFLPIFFSFLMYNLSEWPELNLLYYLSNKTVDIRLFHIKKQCLSKKDTKNTTEVCPLLFTVKKHYSHVLALPCTAIIVRKF